MLYVGHFSFESLEEESDAFTVESKGGTFTCLVEADSLDDAADKFRDLIISHADSFEIFGSAGAVFIDAIIEVKKLPEEGVLTQLYEPLADRSGSFATTSRRACGVLCCLHQASRGRGGGRSAGLHYL